MPFSQIVLLISRPQHSGEAYIAVGICSAQASVKMLADEVQLSAASGTVGLTQHQIEKGNSLGISIGTRDTGGLHQFQSSRADLMPGSEGQAHCVCLYSL